MKVLHICNQFWPSTGGIEKFTLDLCRESKKNGIECEVLCLNRISNSKEILSPRGETGGIPITRVPFLDLKYYKPALLPLGLLKKADIIHVHGVGALLDFVALTKPLHKKPIVVSTHGGIFHTRNVSTLKKIYFFGWQRAILSAVDQVVACSKNDFELFKLISKKLLLIENGVDVERFLKIRQKQKQQNVFLFVGRLSKNKRIDRLLDVFGELKRLGTDFELRIVGKDWEKILKPLGKRAEELKISENVFFVGEIPDSGLENEYARASFFVSASEYEGFGISVIEAMAAGCVPILNRIASFENFVEENRTGFLVDFENAKGTAEKIAEIMGKSFGGISAQSKKTAKRFSWQSRIREWKKIYETISQKKESEITPNSTILRTCAEKM